MTDLVTERTDVLTRLTSLCRGRELGSLATRLADVASLVENDMMRLELELAVAPPKNGESRSVVKASNELLAHGGKRLRPMCVALAARVGSGFDARALELAVSVELVHNATLLHDDVVDLGDTRRGAPTARTLYGNAISIFAGDWLLVEALRRVRKTEVSLVLERLLDVIEEMVLAESLQLEARGTFSPDRARWQQVVEGKTAALFRWAMFAGARAGGLGADECAVLERYGTHLGIAFQAVDDALDLAGDPQATGKALFTDLREGKMTYPLIVAAEREPAFLPILANELADDRFAPKVLAWLESTGALRETRAYAEEQAALAIGCLDALPEGRAIDAIVTVAHATVARKA